MALRSGTIFRRAIPSFQLDTSYTMAPVGTDAPNSRPKDKQPARSPPDATISPSPQLEVPSSSGATQQSSSLDQRLTSLENSLSQLLSLIQQAQEQQQSLPPEQPATLQPLPPAPQQQAPSLSQPMRPPATPPPPQQIPISMPTVLAPGVSFVPPISLNPTSGMSLDRSFPHVEPALRLAIAKHDFRPGHLYKLDATVKERPKPRTFEISDDGEFTQRDRDASPKDYPSFRTLYDPLVVYFEILEYFIISSGNIPAIQQVVLGCSEYLRLLYQIYTRYEWSAVLQYHFMFHNRRIAEMREGDYSGWRTIDSELAALYLYSNPKPPNRATTSSSSTNAKQTCFAFQTGKCSTPCPQGRQHKCKNCNNTSHGRSTCTEKSSTA